MYNATPKNYESWREMARKFLLQNVLPEQIVWNDKGSQQSLFEDNDSAIADSTKAFSVPKEFLSMAKWVSCHINPERWALLYSALWRLTHNEKHLLKLTTDSVVRSLNLMEKAVRRDTHKMKAFVRFRKTIEDGEEHYIAWHKPDHLIVRMGAPFFQRRFSVMRWTIITPDESVHWDGEQLHYGPGMPVEAAPQEDIFEDLWRSYYRATFNPARIKIKMMKREMPVRYWANLPETRIIDDMLAEAPERVQAMLKHSEGLATSATLYLPQERIIPALRQAAKKCEACPLYACAKQTVFGEGAVDARIMIVGEQPGDEEDKQGRPFVGPAGQLLNQILAEIGIARDDVYLTNAIKHFRYKMENGKRIHVTGDIHHLNACKPWLETEIAIIKPEKIICLGVTAARALISHGFTMKTNRGVWGDYNSIPIMATYHPSYVLRTKQGYEELVGDLRGAIE